MRQVGGAHEQDIDAIDGGHLGSGLDAGPGLDLDDAHDLLVAGVDRVVTARAVGEPAREQRHAALAHGREAQPARDVPGSRGSCDTWGTITPSAPRSRTRPMRSRVPSSTRTSAVASVDAMAASWGSRSASVPDPCSRSTSTQSSPARAEISAAWTEARFRKVPNRLSPARMRARSVFMGHGWVVLYVGCGLGRSTPSATARPIDRVVQGPSSSRLIVGGDQPGRGCPGWRPGSAARPRSGSESRFWSRKLESTHVGVPCPGGRSRSRGSSARRRRWPPGT